MHSKPNESRMDEFNRIVLNLEELEVTGFIEFSTKSLKNFKNTLKLSRDVLTIDLIMGSMRRVRVN